MVNGHKYYFFDNGQMAADQYVELNYYDANGLRDRTHDVRLMGKRRPSDSEKEQITKELAGVPREWIKRFAESGWELMYYTDKAYFSAPKTEQGIYFINYDTDVHYKKIKFSKPQGLAMAFGEFAASELSDEETSRALTDFERYLAGSGLVQPLPSHFDDKPEMQFGSFSPPAVTKMSELTSEKQSGIIQICRKVRILAGRTKTRRSRRGRDEL